MAQQIDTERPFPQDGITRVAVSGFKAISQQQAIEIRPLTLLAGANSSGKSSMMQPLLLLKQTLEASYDPGALLLNGPNVKFTSAEQVLSCVGKSIRADAFQVGVGAGSSGLVLRFDRQPGKGFEIRQMTIGKTTFRPNMTHDEIAAVMPLSSPSETVEWVIRRDRCFLEAALVAKNGDTPPLLLSPSPVDILASYIQGLIHLPGLRGNPERTYPVTAVGAEFPGTFEHYVASIIVQWQAEKNDKIEQLTQDLRNLDLTWKIVANRVNDTQVELQVGRTSRAARGGARDLVNVADVGFGVSQTLPVLVALHAAAPEQLVYLEQPEIHLHPNAQFALARALSAAAARGVRVVAETHSALLLLGVQTLVAEGKLDPGLVKLHWFKRGADGATRVTSADLDDAGAFGDWPEDFADAALAAESRYLDAAEKRQRRA